MDQRPEDVTEELERLRRQLLEALDAAGGDQQDANVQAIARRFDQLLAWHMSGARPEIDPEPHT